MTTVVPSLTPANPASAPAPALPALPALRCLGDLAKVRPSIVIDTREQTPLPFSRLTTISGTLMTGDYSYLGGQELFAVERKTVPDSVSCCTGDNRDRSFRELHRLRGFRFRRLLIVGDRADIEAGRYASKTKPQAVLATLGALESRFDVPVVFASTPEEAGRKIESWTYWCARELVLNVNVLARAAGLTCRDGRASPITDD
jgi:DNA excision repair protein ERCC-4